MEILIVGLVVFFTVHAVPNFTHFKQTLIAKRGEKGYKALFSIAAAIGLALIVFGKANAPYVFVYDELPLARDLAKFLMPIALILLAGTHMPTNIKRFVRHPMLLGVTIWGILHLAVNGDLGSILLFGSFTAYSIIAMPLISARQGPRTVEPVPLKKDVIVVVAGIFATAVFVFLHGPLFGRALY